MCTLPSRDPFRRLEVVTREIGNGQANARCQVLGKLKDFGDLLFIEPMPCRKLAWGVPQLRTGGGVGIKPRERGLQMGEA